MRRKAVTGQPLDVTAAIEFILASFEQMFTPAEEREIRDLEPRDQLRRIAGAYWVAGDAAGAARVRALIK